MKKIHKLILPEVHILGDQEDVNNLFSGIARKNVVLIFQDGDQGLFYLKGKKKFKLIGQKEMTKMEKKFQLLIVSFFPSRKKVEPLTEEMSVVPVAVPDKAAEKPEKIDKNDKKPKKEKKDKKGKKKE